jgi:hypothetical protein
MGAPTPNRWNRSAKNGPSGLPAADHRRGGAGRREVAHLTDTVIGVQADEREAARRAGQPRVTEPCADASRPRIVRIIVVLPMTVWGHHMSTTGAVLLFILLADEPADRDARREKSRERARCPASQRQRPPGREARLQGRREPPIEVGAMPAWTWLSTAVTALRNAVEFASAGPAAPA